MNLEKQYKQVKDFLRKRYRDLETAAEQRDSDPYKTLVSCIISQRTKEERTREASKKLFIKAQTPQEVSKLDEDRLAELIRPAGMYNQKASRIKKLTEMLLEKHGGKVPESREELMKLPGVGYKTADVTRCFGFGAETIAVDTHVNRIPKRIGWVPEKATFEQVKEKLEELVPRKERRFFHTSLIHFGREICQPIKPRCEKCSFTEFCEYYKKNRVQKNKAL